jgi:HEPN domain-containing protein
MKDRNALIKEWLHIADEDIFTAKILLNHDYIYPRSICFHCQQSAEKYLKAYLIYFDLDVIKTHDLSSLINQLQGKDETILELINIASVLTPYAVSIRYPDDFDLITEDEAREAYQLAVTIKDYVQSKLILSN